MHMGKLFVVFAGGHHFLKRLDRKVYTMDLANTTVVVVQRGGRLINQPFR